MDLKRYFPTYYRWFDLWRRSSLWKTVPLVVAQDAWQGIERRCVLEIGRGQRKTTHWQANPQSINAILDSERIAVDRSSLATLLGNDLRKISGIGLPCDVVLQPPWAVAKVFQLTEKEAANPEHWIAQHREAVFTRESEDDILLTYRVRRDTGANNTLVLGLARKSVLQEVMGKLEEAGSPVGRIIHGPLWALEHDLPDPVPEFGLLLDRSGSGSYGCWVLAKQRVVSWAEIVDEAAGSIVEQHHPEVLHAYFGDLVDDFKQVPQVTEIRSYRPDFSAMPTSRWRLPKSAPPRAFAELTPLRRQFAGDQVQTWASWAFRWATLVAVTALFFIVAGNVIRAVGLGLQEPAAFETNHWRTHRERQLVERERLMERVTSSLYTEQLGIRPSLLWLKLGVAKKGSAWLRNLKSQAGRQQTGWWLVEGLSLDRESPYAFANDLAERSGWQTRVTRLEAVDISRAKRIPPKLKQGVFRFAMEVKR